MDGAGPQTLRPLSTTDLQCMFNIGAMAKPKTRELFLFCIFYVAVKKSISSCYFVEWIIYKKKYYFGTEIKQKKYIYS